MSESRFKTFNYAIGMFGTSIPINMLKTFAAAYYVIGLGLTTPQLSRILFVYAFIDAADNLVYGFLSDRTRTRWGRRRPWLVIATPLLALGLILFYSTPAGFAGTSLFVWAMLFYIFTGTIDSVINANYSALFPELFRTNESRAAANAMRQAFQLVAMIISIALTPMVTKAIGYSLTSIAYGILGGVVILYMALTSHEVAIQPEERKPRLWDSVKSLLTNRKFWVAGVANAFYSAAMSLVMASMTFYTTYTLKLGSGQTSLLFAAVLVIAIACVGAWAALVKRFTLMPVWRIALAVLLVAFVPLYFAASLVTALIASAFVGFGFAGVITTMDLVHARVMDEDREKHDVRREGIISNALGFMNRLNGLFTSLAFYLIFVLFKFESGDNPGSSPDQASRFLLTVFPAAMMVLSLVVSFFISFPETGKAAAEKSAKRSAA
jgi:glycoside/pentoside/hexuronide:cation symporter, GPH family